MLQLEAVFNLLMLLPLSRWHLLLCQLARKLAFMLSSEDLNIPLSLNQSNNLFCFDKKVLSNIPFLPPYLTNY